MAEPIWTQDDIDALKRALRTGVLSVTFADRTVTYHKLSDMRALLAEMIASVSPETRPFRLAATDKGV